MEKIRRSALPTADITEKFNPSSLAKWIPLMCAGAAAGVSILALHEIKKARMEIALLKKENCCVSPNINPELSMRMENMETQLKTLTDFIKNKDKITKETEIIRNVVKQSQSENVTIINEDEYEEVEVTDDEAEEIEEN